MSQQESIEKAKRYVEDVLTFFEVNTSVETAIRDDFIDISVPTTENNSLLIGRNAETLRALQSLTANMLRNNNADLTRVNLDIADYKKQRAERIAEQTREWIEEIRKTGSSKVVHMNAADRRVVHGVVAEYSDMHSSSEGEGRDRHLIITQASS